MVACKIGTTFILDALNLLWRLATTNGLMLVRLEIDLILHINISCIKFSFWLDIISISLNPIVLFSNLFTCYCKHPIDLLKKVKRFLSSLELNWCCITDMITLSLEYDAENIMTCIPKFPRRIECWKPKKIMWSEIWQIDCDKKSCSFVTGLRHWRGGFVWKKHLSMLMTYKLIIDIFVTFTVT